MNKVTPHVLRRTHGSKITGLGLGRRRRRMVPGGLLFSALSGAALAQPTDEPSDRERGQQKRDDHADA